MGIPNFFKIFENQKQIVKIEKFKGKTLIIDAFLEIYRSALAVPVPLKNSKGDLTSHINTIFQNIVKYKQLNITPIFVFDQKSCKLKRGILYKRKEKRDKAIEKMNETECEKKKNKLFKSAFVINSNIIDEVKYLLTLMGIQYIMAPKKYESEQYAAKLVQEGIGYAVITTDADALLFGASKLIKRERKGKLSFYDLNEILKENKITLDELIKIGVALGCDFAKKVPRIGIKTALKKVKEGTIKFDDEHIKAINYFKEKVPDAEIIKNSYNNQTLKELYEWLVYDKEFNSTRVFNILVKYGYEGEKIEFTNKKNQIILGGSNNEFNGIDDDKLIELIMNNNI